MHGNSFAKMLFIVLSISMFASCQKVFEAYLGLPLQPENINAEFEPGLNVFGIIKAGTSYDSINHYFEVQQILNVFDTLTEMDVSSAKITLKRIRAGMPEMKYDLYSQQNGNYTNPLILTRGGDIWEYECSYDTFLIKAQTKVPDMPEIVMGSLQNTGNFLEFAIQADSTAFLYDVYFVGQTFYKTKRMVPSPTVATKIDFTGNESGNRLQGQVFVIAYDAQYERYVSTSNTFFKPNAFRPRFSTVEGGYGCFCSANILQFPIH